MSFNLKKLSNSSLLVIILIIFGIVVLYFWRKDVAYKRCMELGSQLGNQESIDKFVDGKCGKIIKDQIY